MGPSLAKTLQMLLVVLILAAARTRHAHQARGASSTSTENGRAFSHGKSTTRWGAQRKSSERGTVFPMFGREPSLCTKWGPSDVRGAACWPSLSLPRRCLLVLLGKAVWFLWALPSGTRRAGTESRGVLLPAVITALWHCAAWGSYLLCLFNPASPCRHLFLAPESRLLL